MWPRPCEWSVEEALKQRPCGVNFKWEQQGEAVAFGEAGAFLFSRWKPDVSRFP